LVWMSGNDGKPRWQLRVTSFSDVHILPVDRLLFSHERTKARNEKPPPPIAYGPVIGATERDFSGNIVWESKGMKDIESCRRLPDGFTILRGDEGVALLTPEGKMVTKRLFVSQGGKWNQPVLLRTGELLFSQRKGASFIVLDIREQHKTLTSVEAYP